MANNFCFDDLEVVEQVALSDFDLSDSDGEYFRLIVEIQMLFYN